MDSWKPGCLPFVLRPPAEYQHKGNCPAPKWLLVQTGYPFQGLDGDTKPGPCAPGVKIETSK